MARICLISPGHLTSNPRLVKEADALTEAGHVVVVISGWSFPPIVEDDQHFAQRGRQPDLLPVIQRHPQLLGIGLDEATAIVVTGSRAEVVGQHAAHFVRADRLKDLPADQLPKTVEDAAKLYVTIPNGGSIDLLTLQPQ